MVNVARMDAPIRRRYLEAQPLRDIRPDLEVRLLSAKKNFDEHSARAKLAGDEVAELTRMLERENQRFAPSATTRIVPMDSLTDFLLETLQEGNRLSKDELRAVAQQA